jgi:hypothetical protein
MFFSNLSGGRWLLLPYFLACALSLVPAYRAWQAERGGFISWRYGFLLIWLFLPPLIVFVMSYALNPVFVSRYLMGCLPTLALLASVGLGQIRREAVFRTALVLIMLLSLLAVRSIYVNPSREDWRGATSYVLDERRHGDAIVFYIPAGQFPFEYYRDRYGAVDEAPVTANFLSPGLNQGSLSEILGVQVPPKPVHGFAERLADSHERVWLLVTHDHFPGLGRFHESEAVEVPLRDQYRKSSTREFPAIRVTLYEQPSP